MLELTIPEKEVYDERNNEFIYVKETKLVLEHSLISITKWESKWHKPFLSSRNGEQISLNETIDYIRCMTVNKVTDPNVYLVLPKKAIDDILAYIKNPMTATWFADSTLTWAHKHANEIVTAEIIYWWMIDLQIPVEFEQWHLNRLLTLIRVINEKHKESQPKKNKKPGVNKALEMARLNQERRAKAGSKG